MAAQITLRNGERVKINDHVYCAPSWNRRDGTPYSVARVMEFLPSEGSVKGKGKAKDVYTRVRLAWYYRPSDVSERAVADSRVLLAAIYSEITEISQLRSKCYVIHRDKISDLAGWKKRPDRFYFTRLFDPYIRKEFEVIRSVTVRNVPTAIHDMLVERYEYVVAEKEVVFDLTDTVRLCDTCTVWCSTPEAVQCDRCKKYFHMRCVQPPLLHKPSRGYGWTCAPCSMEHDEEVDNHGTRHGTPLVKPKTNAPAVRGRGRPKKDRTQAEKEENMDIKHFKMWPFRYFGQYTVVEDTLDPDDLIFPRAATRVGPRFQATVPEDKVVAASPESEDRGGDATIDVLSNVCHMTSSELSEFDSRITEMISLLPTRTQAQLSVSVDWLTEMVHRLSDAYTRRQPLSKVDMNAIKRPVKWKAKDCRYIDKEWTAAEIAAFEDGIASHGPELRLIREEIRTRSHSEVVRFYGHWKNSCLRSNNAQASASAKTNGRSAKPARASSEPESDDEGSVDLNVSNSNVCGACRTTESKKWWKAPKGLTSNCLCNTCGPNWRKYADLNVRAIRDDSLIGGPKSKSDKREASPLFGPTAKRTKLSGTSPTPSSQLRCLACHKNGPIGKVLKCSQCQVRVHAAACGAKETLSEKWLCELCDNEKTMEAALNPSCLLCPRVKPNLKSTAVFPPADTYLRACKPTEGQGWAHVLCSVFIPEIQFTDASSLRAVEGISVIPRQRWISKCTICGEDGGAVVRCSDCVREYHVSCAWTAQHTFGFEIQPVKSSRREMAPITTFAAEIGHMNAIICCKSHDTSKRMIYSICDTDEGGRTALEVYCLTKQAPVDQAHALLSKARRLDLLLEPVTSVTEVEDDHTGPECQKCHTEYSPIFHAVQSSPDANVWLCNACYVEALPQPREVDHVPTPVVRVAMENGIGH